MTTEIIINPGVTHHDGDKVCEISGLWGNITIQLQRHDEVSSEFRETWRDNAPNLENAPQYYQEGWYFAAYCQGAVGTGGTLAAAVEMLYSRLAAAAAQQDVARADLYIVI